MERSKTGVYYSTTVASETVRAFIPNVLPPVPPLDLSGPSISSTKEGRPFERHKNTILNPMHELTICALTPFSELCGYGFRPIFQFSNNTR